MIGLICGNGKLPELLMKNFTLNYKSFCVLNLNQESYDLPIPVPQEIFKLGHVGKMLDFLKQHNVREIVIAGGVKRPLIRDLSLDSTGLKWLGKLGPFFMKGDDALLRKLTELVEEEGFMIKKPQDYIRNLLTPLGTLTQKKFNHTLIIQKGFKILNFLSEFDMGQALIIDHERILGIEGVEGTEKLIERCPSGVLIKCAKLNQTLDVDVPSIGPDTIKKGKYLDGIVLEAERTQIIEKEKVIQLCDEYGLFLIGVENNF